VTSTPVDPERTAEVHSLVNMLDEILSRVQAAYAQASIDLPDRRYWTLSQPAVDCEQLVVAFVQAYIGPPGDEAMRPQNCHSPRSASIDIQVTRCIPTVGSRGRSPDAASIQDASKQLAIDAWLLLDIAGSLDTWDPVGIPGLGVIATIDAGEPQGGFQSVTLHMTAAIP
jgi:hypothetical protein